MCLCAKTNQNIGENCPAIGKNKKNETGKLYAPLRQGILWNTLLKSIICLSTQFVRLFISSIEGGAEMRPPVLYKTLPNHSVY